MPFCLPLQPSVPPCRERLTFSALSLLQCCSHRRNSARKAINCKNLKKKDKGETRTKPSSVLSPAPQSCCFSFQSGGAWGQCLRKAPFPKENLLGPFQSVQSPSVPVIPHFPHCERLHSTSSLLLELEELCSREMLPRLHSSEQSGSSCEWNYKGHGIIPTMNNQLEWTSQCCLRMEITAGKGLSSPAAEHSTCWDCHRKILCCILSFQLILTCFIFHAEHKLPI